MAERLAILVPVFNEEDNVLPLTRQVAQSLAGHDLTYELVFIDDASTDRTWQRIAETAGAHPQVRGLRHTQNSGQSAAFLTGLRLTQSEYVATLDGDLQNDPADLPRLFQELAGADFVCGVRVDRQDNWLRRVSTRVARRARRLALGIDFQDTGCFLRVFRRSALDSVLPFSGWHRFLPILVHGAGKNVKEVAVHHRPRVAGQSKYGIRNRIWRGLYDLVGVGWLLKRSLGSVPVEPQDPPCDSPLPPQPRPQASSADAPRVRSSE